ncbi:GNAT family N-acetyltransferase [Nocardia miyunensis]|uniref:GNAT family N-acetyltransferase n=1 Tax=Nocardia miyunensis TaxID=282684 RepID=UPI00083372DD|nr:GNAT family N-acetyltransferase [Nocardia miyunensis]
MVIQLCTPADLPEVLDITLEVFGPFYEQTFRSMVTPEVFEHQHGSWAEDYRRMVPGLLSDEQGKHVVLAREGSEIAGYLAWHTDIDRRHGEIDILCVREQWRGKGFGRALCAWAIEPMRSEGAEVVQIGTGGDDFHAPARHLYESLGFSLVPVAVSCTTSAEGPQIIRKVFSSRASTAAVWPLASLAA